MKYQLPFSGEKARNKASVKRDKRKVEHGVKTEGANAFTRKQVKQEHEEHYQSWRIVHNITARYAPSWKK